MLSQTLGKNNLEVASGRMQGARRCTLVWGRACGWSQEYCGFARPHFSKFPVCGDGGEHPPSQMRPATPSRNHGGEQLRPRRRRQRKSRQSTTLHQPIRVSTASHQSVRPPEVTAQRVGPWSPRAHNEQPRRRNPDAGSICRAISSDSANGSSVGTTDRCSSFPALRAPSYPCSGREKKHINLAIHQDQFG
jgi:hypothetical protein